MFKSCRECHNVYPAEYFHADKQAKDGRKSYCKACARKLRRLTYAKSREKIIRSNVIRKQILRSDKSIVGTIWREKYNATRRLTYRMKRDELLARKI